jgi:predicted ester cyclase
MLFVGFPGLRWTIEEMIAKENKIARRLRGRGTHEGEFMSVAPTRKRVGFRGISTVRIREGKIAENRGMPGMPGLLQLLGAVPAAL